MQKLSARIVAVLLLLLLGQKMGLELWLHHFLHETKTAAGHETALQQEPVHCSCVDDTLMPMVGSEPLTLIVSATLLGQRPVPACNALSHSDRIFHALRGPPPQA